MHSARIPSIPPHDAANINIAGASFGMDDGMERQLLPSLSWGEKMQHTVNDNRILTAKISFRLADGRIFRASRIRVRYPDFRHNFGVIKSGSAGVF